MGDGPDLCAPVLFTHNSQLAETLECPPWGGVALHLLLAPQPPPPIWTQSQFRTPAFLELRLWHWQQGEGGHIGPVFWGLWVGVRVGGVCHGYGWCNYSGLVIARSATPAPGSPTVIRISKACKTIPLLLRRRLLLGSPLWLH